MGSFSAESVRQQNDTWLTPPEILHALGEFDLDPCCPVAMPWRTAAKMYTLEENGLIQPWFGRVWLNPPWGSKATPWIRRLAEHGNGIALLPARTETRAFFSCVWEGGASSVLFVRGRLRFHYLDGTKASAACGAPTSLVAYGEDNARILSESGLGVCVRWDG